MKVLALEPFYGGSHKSFLDGWRRHSEHEFTVLGLPAYKWKWRMRHSAVTFASQLRSERYRNQVWDVLWVSDMLNLAEFVGLTSSSIQQLPRVTYFHENQLTYPAADVDPASDVDQRDLHFAFSNFTSALAADQVWFNSEFHRVDFLNAMDSFLLRMPDHVPREELRGIHRKTAVQHPGIEPIELVRRHRPGPLRICWNARWEHDKHPEAFFAAIRRLKTLAIPFRLIVLGESFRASPATFAASRESFKDEIEHWGYVESTEEYRQWLSMADVVVSTANHEFFGIGVIEAMSAGAIPVLPRRLAYPGLLEAMELDQTEFTYDGSVDQLLAVLSDMARQLGDTKFSDRRANVSQAARAFAWPRRAAELDRALHELTASTRDTN